MRYTGCRVGFGQKTEAGCKDGIPTLGSSRSHQTSLLQLLAMGNLGLLLVGSVGSLGSLGSLGSHKLRDPKDPRDLIS